MEVEYEVQLFAMTSDDAGERIAQCGEWVTSYDVLVRRTHDDGEIEVIAERTFVTEAGAAEWADAMCEHYGAGTYEAVGGEW